MKTLIFKLLTLTIFLANSFHVVAGDTITFVNPVSYIHISIIATIDKHFTLRCVTTGVEQTYTGKGQHQSIGFSYLPLGNKETIIEGEEGCKFTFFSSTVNMTSADFSKCPSIEILRIHSQLIESINLSNCVNLEQLSIIAHPALPNAPLRNLDLSDCKSLYTIICTGHKLSVLNMNINNNPAMERISIYENSLSLSSLYAICEVIQDRVYRKLGRQNLNFRRVLIKDTLDYSSQKEFGGVATNFWILNGYKPSGYDGSLAHPSEYTVDNGVIAFHKDGFYTVDMRNPIVVSNPQMEGVDPTRAILVVQVIDFVPVREITNVPASVPVGIQYIFGSYRIVVLPENATYKEATWKVTDAGTTGATIVGTSLRTTAPGTVKLTATIKDGLAFDEDYTQDFVIEVTPLSIDEAAQALEAIEVYPNPTTGELRIENGKLRIENVEVFDVYGRKVSSHHLITSSSHHLITSSSNHLITSSSNHLINISHLPAGTYFVKIMTEQGEVVRKVVKQ